AGGIEQDVDDVAGNDAQQHEDDDRDPDQGHEHQGEASHDISKHLATLPDYASSSNLSPSLPATNAKRLRKGARDKIAKQFCAEATKQSMSRQVARWIASLRSQ